MLSEDIKRYEKLVLVEDSIYRKIRTCSQIEMMLLDDVFDGEVSLQRDMTELFLLFLTDVNHILHRQLAKVQLDKKIVARRMRENRSNSLHEGRALYLCL